MSDTNPPREPRREDFQTTTRNPFASDAPSTRPVGALANAEQQRSIAEVQARMIIARANPRDPLRCMDLILQDCTRPTLAEKGLYHYARGGSSIDGPSIRLAEAIAQRWGNIASGIKEISRTAGYSECVAYAWDLETGYYDERQYQVRHWRDTKSGGYPITDERDIYELIANLGQRRKRAVLLSVIQGDVVEAAQAQCEQTLHATADTSPEALIRIISAFEQFGVSKAQLEKRCQCRFEAVRPAQIVQLRKIFASLKDGMSDAKDWFDAPNGAWGAVDEAHSANGATATTQTSPRRGRPSKAAQEASIPPKQDAAKTEDSVPFDRWEDEKAATPAANETSASATTVAAPKPETRDTAADVTAPEEIGSSPVSSGATPFSAWLVDGEGNEIPDDDGVIEAHTDPVAFAKAYKDAEANEFPGTIELFRRANQEALVAAQIASKEVAAILAGPKPLAPAQPAHDIAAPMLPMEMPIDPAVVFAPPMKPTKADMDKYKDGLKLVAAASATPDALNHVIDVNEPVYDKFPPSHRLACKAIIEARQKEMSPPPPRDAAPRTLYDLAQGMLRDVAALDSVASVNAWRNYAPVVAELERLRVGDPDWYRQVLVAADNRRDELDTPPGPRGIADAMIAGLKACTTAAAFNTFQAAPDNLKNGKFLMEGHPEIWAEVRQAAATQKQVITGGS